MFIYDPIDVPGTIRCSRWPLARSRNPTVHRDARWKAPGLMKRVSPRTTSMALWVWPEKRYSGLRPVRRDSLAVRIAVGDGQPMAVELDQAPLLQACAADVANSGPQLVQGEIAVAEHEVARQESQLVDHLGDGDVPAMDQDTCARVHQQLDGRPRPRDLIVGVGNDADLHGLSTLVGSRRAVVGHQDSRSRGGRRTGRENGAILHDSSVLKAFRTRFAGRGAGAGVD